MEEPPRVGSGPAQPPLAVFLVFWAFLVFGVVVGADG